MREAKQRFLDQARARAKSDQAFAAELGTMLIVGLLEVEAMETYAGDGELEHRYITHFPDPHGGGDWTFTVARREIADAR